MIIEGKLLEVMESWPLQLTVKTETDQFHIELLEETVVTHEGEVVDTVTLRPNLEVRVEGQASGPNAMTAQTIEILTGDS